MVRPLTKNGRSAAQGAASVPPPTVSRPCKSRQQNDLLARAKWIPAYAPGVLKDAAFALTPVTPRQTVRLPSGFFSRSCRPLIRPGCPRNGHQPEATSDGWANENQYILPCGTKPDRPHRAGCPFRPGQHPDGQRWPLLTAPGVIIGRFDEPTSDSAAAYGLRMFGIRTVLLGADLAVLTGKPLRRALGQAVIHGTDQRPRLCPVSAGTRSRVPRSRSR